MQEEETHIIEIEKIKESLQAQIITGNNISNKFITGVYASDLMSDVLAYGKSGSVLLTGLNSQQTAISAYMAEFKAVVFLRGKKPDNDIKKFAEGKNIIILSTQADMYEACVKIANIKGEVPVIKDVEKHVSKAKNITEHSFKIDGQDFASAGMVSTQIKTILKSIGYDSKLIRRIAISTYEAEMNVVMHAKKADVVLKASDEMIKISIKDEGKGIKNIELAMKEGYTTATEEQRALGFGAGMGLPNIKKNSDKLNIESEINKGTLIKIYFFVR
ncbi:MAG: ATP-binding protein [Bacteroidales bacterium]|nr:ATP-binding protein [Bacteroidales bacterium]